MPTTLITITNPVGVDGVRWLLRLVATAIFTRAMVLVSRCVALYYGYAVGLQSMLGGVAFIAWGRQFAHPIVRISCGRRVDEQVYKH